MARDTNGGLSPAETAQLTRKTGLDGATNATPAWATVVSGSVSGVAVGVLLQPLDVLRTRAQARAVADILPRGLVAAAAAVWRGEPPPGARASPSPPRGPLGDAFVASARPAPPPLRGPRAFWAGVEPTLLRLGLGVGVNMLLVETLRAAAVAARAPGPPSPEVDGGRRRRGRAAPAAPAAAEALPAHVNALVGSAARGITAAALTPLVVVKAKGGRETPPPASLRPAARFPPLPLSSPHRAPPPPPSTPARRASRPATPRATGRPRTPCGAS